MSKIGQLKYQGAPNSFEDIRGYIRTLNFACEIRVTPNRNAELGSEAPTHIVTSPGQNSEFIEIGAAWEREMQRGPNAGETFLSVTIDDPSFPNPINFSIFKEADYAVATWRRRQDRA